MTMPTDESKTSTFDVQHNEETGPGLSEKNRVIENAHDAALTEHDLTLKGALKRYPKAVFWSVMVSTAIIMEGYDIVLVTSLFAQPAFAERYGHLTADGSYQLTGPWQSALSCAPTVGAIFGAFLNGYLTGKFGYRKVLLASLVAITGFIFLLFFATSVGMLEAGLVLCGVPWGVFATMAPAYASEVCPLALRGYLTVYVNLCWAIGQLIAAGVLRAFVDRTDQWAYRIPFGIQWAWPLPLVLVLWFAPESPWWLVRKGRQEEALRSITRLSDATVDSARQTVALIIHTNLIEEEADTGTSYWSCFQGTNLRRTEIVCMVFAAQIWCGAPLGGTPAYFFVQAGLHPSVSFDFSVGGLGLACIGTVISWLLLTSLGRRTLYVWGLGLLSGVMLLIGILASASRSSASSFTQAGFVLVWMLVYYLTVGPVCYAIISEIPASKVVGNVIFPYMINPTEGNWRGQAGYFFAGTCLAFFVWAFFRLPETKDRTFEELDILFINNTKARKFTKFNVNAYAEHVEDRLTSG